MPSNFLLGRRIHISGSVASSPTIATADSINRAVEFLSELVKELLRNGATFVIPIDKQPVREADKFPLCFDWLIFKTIADNLSLRLLGKDSGARPLIVAVQHHKNEEQIPLEFRALWDTLKENSGLVVVENAGHWNMNSKRLELQAAQGDILISLGGDEGVLHLANLYHEAGKPVIPLNFPLTAENKGSLKLWERALLSSETDRFFRVQDGLSAHGLINRLNFASQTQVSKKVSAMMDVLTQLRRPVAFGVRLLNPKIDSFKKVDDFFTGIVKYVTEEEFGYELVIVDGSDNKEPFINQEIFNRLHRAGVVIVDTTAERPNCFIELGYALGRGLPTMVCAHENTDLPFDTKPVPTHRWNDRDLIEDGRRKFREYWRANAQRRRIVEPDPLIR